MAELNTYTTYITIFFLAINLLFGKLKLISLLWIYKMQKRVEPNIGMSVIICSRNDLENLQHNLPAILKQDYHTYEIIVVNDASTDGTKAYLDQLATSHAALKVIHIQEKTNPGKKKALQVGIEHAQYPFLLLTDADCSPNTHTWIKSQAQFANEEGTVVLGYGAYKKLSGFLNKLIRFDTAYIAMTYMSRALWHYPYMGVGRNMGYSKELTGELEKLDKSLASGDDDLFVQAISKKSKFMVNLEAESFTTSLPKQHLKSWLNQKGRHTTTAPHYSFITQLSLLLQWMVSAGIYLGIIILLLTGDFITGATLFLLNTLSLFIFNGLWIRKLGEKDLILLTPLLDFIYTFVQPIFVIKSWGRKKDQWN